MSWELERPIRSKPDELFINSKFRPLVKIVQSFWTKPSVSSGKLSDDNRMDGGWVDRRAHFYSWTYSCLKAFEVYKDIELVTDREGKKILVDYLSLPYKSVITELNNIDSYPSDLWALGKLYAYSMQKKPFIHIDSDVYFSKGFPDRLLQAKLVAQNFDYNSAFYFEILGEIRKQFRHLPTYFSQIDYSNIISINAGIIGGNDVSFFREYTNMGFDFIDKYKDSFEKISNLGLLNVVYEQLFFFCLAETKGITIECLIESDKAMADDLCRFHLFPNRQDYLHVLGRTNKKSRLISDAIEQLVILEYPHYYTKINSLLCEFKI